MRTIDADELIKTYEKETGYTWNAKGILECPKCFIDNAPTVEISGLPKIHYDRGFIAGYEKGKAERPQGNDDCEGCKHDNKASTEYPCSVCKNNHPNMFEWRSEKNETD